MQQSTALYTCLHLQVHISYLEIYNETGYDLLDPNREIEMLEDLPKVRVPSNTQKCPPVGSSGLLHPRSTKEHFLRLHNQRLGQRRAFTMQQCCSGVHHGGRGLRHPPT